MSMSPTRKKLIANLAPLLFTLLSHQTAFAYYDPGVQRWLNTDPLGEPGFELVRGREPDLFGDGPNLYAFVRNSPTQRVDRSGLSWGGFGFFRRCAMKRCISKVNKWAKKCKDAIPKEPEEGNAWDWAEWATIRMEAIALCMKEAKKMIEECQKGANFVPPATFPWQDTLIKGAIDLPVTGAPASLPFTPTAPPIEW